MQPEHSEVSVPAVEMSIPAGPVFFRAVRLVASSMATDIGFEVDHLEDLRVAVNEVCGLFVSDPERGRIEIRLVAGESSLEIDGRFQGPGEVREPDWLMAEILAAVTDELKLPTEQSPSFGFVSRRE